MVVELILAGLLSPLLIAVTLGLERVEHGLDECSPPGHRQRQVVHHREDR